MRRFVAAVFLLAFAASASAADADFNGRWLIEPELDPLGRVAWLQVRGAGSGSISGSVVGLQPGGQVDPISKAEVEAGELRFIVERQIGQGDKRRRVEVPTRARLVGAELHGVTQRDGAERRWVGRRAPEITETDDGSWKPAETVVLFGGEPEDYSDRWRTIHEGRQADWRVENGALVNSKGADVLVSRETFWNFDLSIVFRVVDHSNSGVALRGRYEIQILGDYGEPASVHSNGAVYSRIPPQVNASKPGGEWQTLELRLVGRELSARLNGRVIHDKVELEGFTALASDWRESEPGPLTLQGDHGKVEFRRIAVTRLKR